MCSRFGIAQRDGTRGVTFRGDQRQALRRGTGPQHGGSIAEQYGVDGHVEFVHRVLGNDRRVGPFGDLQA